MKPEVSSRLRTMGLRARRPCVVPSQEAQITADQFASRRARRPIVRIPKHVHRWPPLLLLLLTVVFAPATPTKAKETVRLQCTPRTFRVVPGEPMRLELTVRADSAASIRLHVPGDPSLKLRAVEKLPVRQTAEGVIVHQRVVVWQGLEPGLIKIDQLSVETKGQKLLFPEVTITVRDPGQGNSPYLK